MSAKQTDDGCGDGCSSTEVLEQQGVYVTTEALLQDEDESQQEHGGSQQEQHESTSDSEDDDNVMRDWKDHVRWLALVRDPQRCSEARAKVYEKLVIGNRSYKSLLVDTSAATAAGAAGPSSTKRRSSFGQESWTDSWWSSSSWASWSQAASWSQDAQWAAHFDPSLVGPS